MPSHRPFFKLVERLLNNIEKKMLSFSLIKALFANFIVLEKNPIKSSLLSLITGLTQREKSLQTRYDAPNDFFYLKISNRILTTSFFFEENNHSLRNQS